MMKTKGEWIVDWRGIDTWKTKLGTYRVRALINCINPKCEGVIIASTTVGVHYEIGLHGPKGFKSIELGKRACEKHYQKHLLAIISEAQRLGFISGIDDKGE